MFMGIIGEYIGKIYMETKARPRYIIAERTPGLEQEAPPCPDARSVPPSQETGKIS